MALHEHNTKFSCQAAAAKSQMSDREVKDLYLDSLGHTKVRDHLLPFLHLPLQQLQAKALDLAHAWKSTGSGQNRANTRPNHQNPNRVQCPKCNWWYDKTKGETCKCPTGGRSGRPLPSKPRIQEAMLGAEEAEPCLPCEVCEEPTCPGCEVEPTPEEDLF